VVADKNTGAQQNVNAMAFMNFCLLNICIAPQHLHKRWRTFLKI